MQFLNLIINFIELAHTISYFNLIFEINLSKLYCLGVKDLIYINFYIYLEHKFVIIENVNYPNFNNFYIKLISGTQILIDHLLSDNKLIRLKYFHSI